VGSVIGLIFHESKGKRGHEGMTRRLPWLQPSGWGRLVARRSKDPALTCRGLKRGINFGNALEAPSEGLWGVILRKEYFTAIRKAGFATVRVPICWSAHASVEAPYAIDPVFLERVDWVVAQAKSCRLHAILDFQHYLELFEDPARNEERFLSIWRQVAEHYRDEPPTILFELLNEPHGRLDATIWNRLLARALAVVRSTNPTRLVLVGPVNWNDIGSLSSLVMPDDDRYLVTTVHFYHPKEFTHQGAEWEPGSTPWLGNIWQGTDAEKQAIDAALAEASAWGKTHHRPIYLGEFGAYSKADLDSRLRWTRHVARRAEAHGMAWAYWEFCSGFGAYDPVENKWRAPLLDALIP
jgi:endoglucanase